MHCSVVQNSVARFEGCVCKSYSMDSLLLSKNIFEAIAVFDNTVVNVA
jgi:hypothetical protein